MTKKQAIRAYDLISGERARKYRKNVARFVSKNDGTFLSTKFKLECPEGSLPSFAEFRKAYDVIEGVDEGSLVHFLFTCILSGFRIFSKEGEAKKFPSRDLYASQEQAFAQACVQIFGGDLPNFRPEKILNRLETVPRSTNGKDNSFIVPVIAAEFQKDLTKKPAPEASAEKIEAVFKEIANALTVFGSWNNLKKNKLQACRLIDEILSKNALLPSLVTTCEKGENPQFPKSSTVSYDSKAISLRVPTNYEPYAVVATLLRDYQPEEGDRAKFVQNRLTTANSNGLSWLFSKGFQYWRTTPVEEIAKAYGVPTHRQDAVDRIHQAVTAISPLSLISGKSYGDFRVSIGGRLDSWVANYIKRLEELEALLEDLPDALVLPSAFIRHGQDFLVTTDCKRAEIELLCQDFALVRKTALNSVRKLLGAANTGDEVVAAVTDVVRCAELLNRLFAIRELFTNAMEQAYQDDNSPWKTISKDVAEEFAPWKQLKKLPKLNGFNGGVPNVEESLQETLKSYYEVLAAREKHLKKIEQWVKNKGIAVDVVEHQVRLERTRLQSRNANKTANPEELGIRFLLNQVARLVRTRSDQCTKEVRNWFEEKQIFLRHKDYHQYFDSKTGSLYVSPFSNRRHQGYALTPSVVLNRAELWKELSQLLKSLSFEPFSEAAETLLRLQALVEGHYLSSIEVDIPHDIAAMGLPESYAESIPSDMVLSLAQQNVPASILSKAFNLYMSLISGYLIVLRRERFFVRTKFTWIKNGSLIYVPKKTLWSMPERYLNNPTWATWMDEDFVVFDDSEKVDVQATFLKIHTRIKQGEYSLGAFLRELPHDWCYALPFGAARSQEQTEVFEVFKDGSAGVKVTAKKLPKANLARLVGPSSLKSRLDDILIDREKTVGDVTLLVDQPMKQMVRENSVQLEPERPILTLVTPMAQVVHVAQEDEAIPFTRIVAIDQGEAGLAYAVFNLSDWRQSQAKPLTVGTIPIRSIRRLIKGVKRYRKAGQFTQKFNQRFDSTMFTIRENVAGDVCGVIEGLMHRFHAFPILENEVKNLASGSKQLALVYKKVNARFLHSDVDMQNAERKAWWYGANCWQLPGYYREVPSFVSFEKKTMVKIDGKVYKPLNLYPGAGVRASMTSRICSHCGRNAFDLLFKAKEDGVKKVSVTSEGEVKLGEETLKLFARPNYQESKAAARLNERADWVRPLEAGEYTLEELTKRIRENLRRAPKSLQSKDTTQSQYFCVFKDCDWNGHGHHADENAAVNIGRRFLASIVYMKSEE